MTLDELLKSTARSLYLSARILPRGMRKTFYCGYLICRAADTVADTALIDSHKRARLIKHYLKMIETQDAALLAEFKAAIPAEAKIYPAEKTLLDNLDLCIKEFNALSAPHKKLILDVAGAVCRAMEWDLSYFPAEDCGLLKAVPGEAETIRYCEDMGGQPGVFWAKLLLNGKEDKEFLENAKKIGMALQITNILRDTADDIKIGRCYLPFGDLSANGLMPQDLLEKKSYKKFRPVVYKWVGWGVDNILAAPAFIAKIPRYRFFARAAVIWPVLWSLDTMLLLANSRNLLDASQKYKIPRKTIYLTMLASPFYCFSNSLCELLIRKKAAKVKEIIPLS